MVAGGAADRRIGLQGAGRARPGMGCRRSGLAGWGLWGGRGWAVA